MTEMTKFMLRSVSIGVGFVGVFGFLLFSNTPAPAILVAIAAVLYLAGNEKPNSHGN